jgi:hypothetical protein
MLIPVIQSKHLNSFSPCPATTRLYEKHWGQVWWYTSIILALKRLRQKDERFSLGYIARSCLKKKKSKTKETNTRH